MKIFFLDLRDRIQAVLKTLSRDKIDKKNVASHPFVGMNTTINVEKTMRQLRGEYRS